MGLGLNVRNGTKKCSEGWGGLLIPVAAKDSTRSEPSFKHTSPCVCVCVCVDILMNQAYCRNSVDGQWYSYDDSSVETVPDEEVCTRGAYILFYQRRNTIPHWSARSSLRGQHNLACPP